jgi:mannose-6-phosphate isomerase-like protein (cupin superfamily)
MSKDNPDFFETRSLAETVDHIAPDGSEIRLLTHANSGGLAHCTLPAGKTSNAVAHKTVEEIWFFTAGRGQVWRKVKDVESIIDVQPGLSLTIPTGVSFQFRNTGDEQLEFIIATMPPWPGPQEARPVSGYWESNIDSR